MSRVAKWKLDKTKIKVVFRLQFHATHIPQPGWDKLFVSFIPADSGKATAKTTKANVKNGNCKWSDPIYETTRLLQDAKTKKYDGKLYKFLVAMGSSRSSLLGEATINLADYADASKPLSVALPLQGCNFGTVLHVTVQLLTSKTGFREFEQQRELREGAFQMVTDQSFLDEPTENLSASAETANDSIDKVNARVRFKSESKELPSLEEEGELNEDNTDSAVGIDGSSYTSESLYADKHDVSSAHEIDSIKSTISGEMGGLSLSQSLLPEKGDQCDHRLLAQGSNDWVHGWSSDYSLDNDLATAYEENGRLKRSLEMAESSVLELKLEVNSLQNHADELGAETQRFSQQLTAEIALGEELSKEVSILKSECSKFKYGFEQLKHYKGSQHFIGEEADLSNTDVFKGTFEFPEVGNDNNNCKNPSFPSAHVLDSPAYKKCDPLPSASFDSKFEENFTRKDQDCLFHDMQMGWSEGLLLMEDKIREIQNKASLGYHGRAFDFLHPDLEALDCVLRDLKKRTTLINSPQNVGPEKRTVVKDGAANVQKSEHLFPGDGIEGCRADRFHLDGMLNCSSMSSQVPQQLDLIENKLDAADVMNEKICELLNEIGDSKAERERLTKKTDEMECYYESLIQELEESQKQMLNELQNLKNEHSTCHYTISTFKSQMEKMQLDMNEQFLRFAEERSDFDSLNKELERRAITSETALKRVQWNYSIAVDRLQKDLELLSLQVLSMYETNENLARQAFAEASQLCFQEQLQEHSGDVHLGLNKDDSKTSLLREQNKTRVQETQADIDISRKSEQELFSKLNGTSVKLYNEAKFHANHIVEDKDISLTEEPRPAELQVNLKDVPVNDLKVENICRAASPQNLTQEKDLVAHADLISETERDAGAMDTCSYPNDEFPVICSFPKPKMDSQESNIVEHVQCRNQNEELKKQLLDKTILLKEMERSLCLQEELHSKAEAELSEMCILYIHLEVFSKVLQDTLHEASDEFRCMEERTDELAQQLQHSDESTKLLMLKLQTAADNVELLKDSEAKFVTKCDDLILKNQILEAKLLGISDENCLLSGKAAEYEKFINECRSYESKNETCAAEIAELRNLLKWESLEKTHLQSEISSLVEELKSLRTEFDSQSTAKEDLEQTVTFLQDKLGDLRYTMLSYDEKTNGPAHASESSQHKLENEDFISTILQLEELQRRAYERILRLCQEKKAFEEQRDATQGSLNCTGFQILFMKQKFESDLQCIMTKLDASSAHLEKLQLGIEDVEFKLKIRTKAEAKYAEHNSELSSKLAVLEVELQHITGENRDLTEKMLAFESVKGELERTKLTVTYHIQENKSLTVSLQIANEESARLSNEVSILKERLRCTNDELQFRRDFRDQLEATVTDLTSQLNEKHEQLLSFEEQKAELVDYRKLVSDLELEKSEVRHLLLHCEECLRKGREDASFLRLQVADLDTHLAAMHEYWLAADVEVIFTKKQFQIRMQEIVDENARLLTALCLLRSELEILASEKRELLDYPDRNCNMLAEVEDYKTRAAMVEVGDSQETHRYEVEFEQLKNALTSSEEVIDKLISSRNELEIMVIVLRSKLDEQRSQISLLEGCSDELMKLQNLHSALTHRLSEQILKTEEFKNLSIHLKELKDKADADYVQAREKRETEGPSIAMQDSLRIAFIREQCETKIQELRSQLYVSKKHGEEMLLKLQNAIDEVEYRKKNEACHLKKNEELSIKVLELESELQAVLSNKWEKVQAYDMMKAELECSMISLDCCKEEKHDLEVSLQKCNEERTKVAVELSSMKERLESLAFPANVKEQGNHEVGAPNSVSVQPLSEVDNVSILSSGEMDDACQVPIDESNYSNPQTKLRSSQEDLARNSVIEVSRQVLVEQNGLLNNDVRHIALINEHFKERSLKSSMDRLHKELERMKDENLASLLQQDELHLDPAFQGLQKEFLQLRTANEQLGNIFPLFNEFSGSGNAMERVLALEIELAEALQAKKKSNIHFQSSFLKQHNDEEAVFKSFRDLNELIKDMLELKRRNAAVETELKEMQNRYSQLSLQFAEVQGERERLVMTLKNIRVPKRP